MTREKLIETIQKLLSLATSSNENEAKLAMSRAQELMAKYSIDLAATENSKKKILEIDYNAPPFATLNDQPFRPISLIKITPYVAGEIARIFGCYSMIYMKNGQTKLLGYETNLEVCVFALDSVFNQAYVEYRKGYRIDRSITYAESFWMAFSQKLQERFKENIQHSEGLVIYDPVKQEFDQMTKGLSGSFSFNGANQAGVNAGRETANSVELRKGVVATEGGKFLS